MNEGDIMQVKNGTYQEHLNIQKSLVIENFAGHFPVVDGSDSFIPAFIISSDCTLRGLKIKGSRILGAGSHYGENNISIYNGAILTIEDCEIYDFNHCGIKLFSGRLLADNLIIHDGGWTFLDHAIYGAAGNSGEKTISNCEMYGCSGWGVHLYSYEYDTTIFNNYIHDNFGGIVVTGERNTIIDNTITNNIGGKGIVFFHYGLIDLVVTGNVCSGNTSHDLYLDVSEGEGFTDCVIENNTGTKNFA